MVEGEDDLIGDILGEVLGEFEVLGFGEFEGEI
jgi:hypothetical protein